MNPLAIHRTPSANDAPLSIRHILARGVAQAPAQEIVYADRTRYTYTTLAERVGRLASALTALGVKPGSTVAMMDWDSHRYLECFFAVPMMGAVLHTVNVRISPDQILYTINHAADDVILVNAEFLPILEAIQDKIRPGVKFVLINDGTDAPQVEAQVRRGIRSDARGGVAVVRVSRPARGHARHDVLHDGDHRAAQGRVLQPPPARAAHAWQRRGARPARRMRRSRSRTCTCR